MSLLEYVKQRIIPEIRDSGSYFSVQNDIFTITEGDLTSVIVKELSEQVSNTAPLKMVTNRLSPINIYNKIVDKQAKVYTGAPPQRVVNDQPTVTESVEDIVRMTSFDSVMAEMDFNLRAYQSCLLEPFINGGDLNFRVVPANAYWVHSDNPVDPLTPTHVSIYKGTTKDGKAIWFHYSADEIVVTDGTGKDLTSVYMPDLEDNKNPIGTLPFSYINMSRQQLVPVPRKDLLQMSKLLPIMLSDLSVGVMLQAFSIFIGLNVSQEDAKNFNLHPSAFWTVEAGEDLTGGTKPVDIKTLSPDINIREALELIKTQLVLLLETNNLSSTAIGNTEGQDASSGIALLIKNIDSIEDERKSQRKFIPVEKDIWSRLIPKFIEYGKSIKELDDSWPRLPENMDMSILFPPAILILSEADKLLEIEQKMNLGLITIKDAYKILHPDLSDEQVEEELESISIESGSVARKLENDKKQAYIDKIYLDTGVVSASDVSSNRFDEEGRTVYTTTPDHEDADILLTIDKNEG